MTPSDDAFFGEQRSRVEFPLTHWTVVLTAANPAAPLSNEALEELCRAYWRPVYQFIRQQNRGWDDPQDLTQEFFAGFLKKELVKRADPTRGRFRAFLLCALKHFLADKWAYARAQKRDGGGLSDSLDQPDEAGAYRLVQVADPAASPDLAYEKEWALALLEHVFSVVRQQSVATCGAEKFEILLNLAMGDATLGKQGGMAAQLGMTPNAVEVAVHRLRRRIATRIRTVVGQTVSDPSEIEAELRYLYDVLGA